MASPWLAPEDPLRQNLLGRLQAADDGGARHALHLSAPTNSARDLLSRIVYGARVSITVAFLSVVLSGVVGTVLGMLAAHYRGWTETVIMRLVDIVLSIPAILLAIITVAVLGPGLLNVVLVLALTRWPRYARVAYGQTLAIGSQPYLRYARYIGASPLAPVGPPPCCPTSSVRWSSWPHWSSG